jgi:photosystem II stability/assembly factor-like uncharacterized protein
VRRWENPVPEPHDEVDTWLNVQVKPLLPSPGTFERVSGQARRRRLRRAVLSAASALAVAAIAAVVIPRVAFPMQETGRPPSAARVSPTPAASPQHPTPAASSPSTIDATTARPLPATRSDPPPLSVTFVGTSTGWVMGPAGPARHCDRPAGAACVVLQRTDSADSSATSWRTVGAPPARGPSGPSGVSQVRFLNLSDGWAFGPELWATHDGGQTWARIDTGGLRVTALEARGDRVYSVWARCTGKGPAFASHCTQFFVYSSSASSDAWSPMPVTSSGLNIPRVHSAASLVLTGTSVYLLLPGGHLFASTPAGVSLPPFAPLGPVPAPCQPGPAQPSGQPSGALLAASGSDLALVCTRPRAGGGQRKTVYASSDGARSWHRTGTAPSPGAATSLAESSSGTLVLATSVGIQVSTDGGVTWTAARGARPAGGFAYVGMTTATQGVAVPADPSRRAIWFTHDGGSTWTASRVGA